MPTAHHWRDENQVLRYLDGTLDRNTARTKRAHLTGCEACREELSRVADAVHATPDEHVLRLDRALSSDGAMRFRGIRRRAGSGAGRGTGASALSISRRVVGRFRRIAPASAAVAGLAAALLLVLSLPRNPADLVAVRAQGLEVLPTSLSNDYRVPIVGRPERGGSRGTLSHDEERALLDYTDVLRNILEGEPDRGSLWLMLGHAELGAARPKAAHDAYEQALVRDLEPSEAMEACMGLASALAELGQHRRALMELPTETMLDTYQPALQYNRARLLIALGEDEEARASIASYVARFGDDRWSRSLRRALRG